MAATPKSFTTPSLDKEQYPLRLQMLERERLFWEINWWRDLADYILPQKTRLRGQPRVNPNDGMKNNSRILDSTATKAIRNLSAGMHGGLTSPVRPWFKLNIADETLSRMGAVRQWLHDVEVRMYACLAKSNFYSSVHDLYSEIGVFGTGAILIEEDITQTVRFRTFTVGEYCISNSYGDEVDCFYRRVWLTARQMVQHFGDKCSPQVYEMLVDDPYKWFEVLHCVQPRNEREVGKIDNKNMPYEQIYMELSGEMNILEVSGYQEFPVVIPRWDTTGSEVYGRSPCMDVLPDVKMLQEMNRTELEAMHKAVNPPMIAPMSFKEKDINAFPGGISYLDVGQVEAMKPLYQANLNVRDTAVKVEKVQAAIKEGLFNDLFLMLVNRPQMTATEVNERSAEKMLVLGPIVERQQTELLDPTLSRVFSIMCRQNLVPQPPQALAGAQMRIEYMGLLSQAQKMSGTQGINALVQFTTPLAQIQPAIMDKLDLDAAVDQYADLVGAPPQIVRDQGQVGQIRQSRAQQQQAQAQAEQQAARVQQMQALGKTPVGNGQNALQQVMAENNIQPQQLQGGQQGPPQGPGQ